MAAITVFHHDEPALQGVGMANRACRHWSGRSLVHLFHKHCAVRKMAVPAIGGDSPRRRIDEMEFLRAGPLISTYRPASQRLIGGAIGVGYTQITGRVFDGLRFLPVARPSRVHLSMRGDGEHCRYSRYGNTCDVGCPHDPVLPEGETMSRLQAHFMSGIPMSSKG